MSKRDNPETEQLCESNPDAAPGNNLLLWSGGVDSTYLLWTLLERGVTVRTLAINHSQVDSAPKEKMARAQLLAELGKRGHKFGHEEIDINTGMGGGGYTPVANGAVQPIIWISVGAACLDVEETLLVAYVRCDNVWHYKGQIVSVFRTMMDIMNKRGDLYFPLEWDHKREIVAELKKQKLFDLTWWCEKPSNGNQCGKCQSCCRMKKGAIH